MTGLKWAVLKPGAERPRQGSGWRYAGLTPHGNEVYHNLPGTWPGPSRVHELSKLSNLDLRGLLYRMLAGKALGQEVEDAMATWDRDQLITAIRDLEDPYRRDMEGGRDE